MTDPGCYDEETRVSLISSLETLPGASGDSVGSDALVSAVDIRDMEGDVVRFEMTELGDRVRLLVNGRPTIDSITALAADEASGVVRAAQGAFRIPPAERHSKLSQLRSLLSRIGVGLSPLPHDADPTLLAPPLQAPRIGAAGVREQAMVRRALAELGATAIGPATSREPWRAPWSPELAAVSRTPEQEPERIRFFGEPDAEAGPPLSPEPGQFSGSGSKAGWGLERAISGPVTNGWAVGGSKVAQVGGSEDLSPEAAVAATSAAAASPSCECGVPASLSSGDGAIPRTLQWR